MNLTGKNIVITGAASGIGRAMTRRFKNEGAQKIVITDVNADEIAAVAAETEAIADQALALIEVEYEDLPAVFDPAEALEDSAPQLHEDKPGNVGLSYNISYGDIAAGEAESDVGQIEAQIALRLAARKAKDFAAADNIRDALAENGIILEDRPDGSTDWRRAG